MTLTDDINEFIKLYKEEFGEDLSFADAQRRAEELIQLLLILMDQPDDPDDAEK